MTSATPFLTAIVEADLALMTENLKKLVSAGHPILHAAADHLFGAGGKRLRPAVVLLASRATMPDQNLTAYHRSLAEITEMIHTASLVHDDVLDESEVRRGIATVHSSFGNRVAVLAGDFLFAQSSWYLANLNNLEVVKLLSRVIMDLAEGEILQGLNRFDIISIDAYLEKTYYKTASLIANSAKSAALLSGAPEPVAQDLYNYGRNLGLAFQIIDDIFDFTASAEVLGKPVGSDLKSGNLTAPVLFALEDYPQLEKFILREFAQEGDLEQTLSLVKNSRGLQRARDLAVHFAHTAVENLAQLPASVSRQALINLTEHVINRSS